MNTRILAQVDPLCGKIHDIISVPIELFNTFGTIKPGRGRKKRKDNIIDCITAFDIETTGIREIEQSIMYIWQFQVDEFFTIIGRTWEEFVLLLDMIEQQIGDNILVCYVHNLSYEFQFLSGIFKNIAREDVFCVDSRKVVRCRIGKIEFRCSYYLSNMSLDEYTHKMAVDYSKIGGFDYNKKRYPWTCLTSKELLYCVNDVRGLVQCIKKELILDDDTLLTIPFTSTGYVRREAKEVLKKCLTPEHRKQLMPEYPVYKMLRQAFRGGDTHANRFYTDVIIEDDIYSYDRASSYPHVQVCEKFPMGKFTPLKETELFYVMDLINRMRKAVIVEVAVYNLELADPYEPNPYLSRHKCRNLKTPIIDNGRVMSAEYLETTLTDIDLKIFMECYGGGTRIEILSGYFTHYSYLPRNFRRLIMKYFNLKSELKGKTGIDAQLYMKSKNKLNSFFGMSAQNPVRKMFYYNGVDFSIDIEKSDHELLEDYNKRNYLPYQWGVWTTALARYELWQMQRIAGDSLLYWDTDSVKTIGSVDFSKYNKEITRGAKEQGGYCKVNNKEYILGLAELDGHYKKFKTLGAKKYAVIKENGRLEITVAGVNKQKGPLELGCYDGIESFNEGFVFYDSAGLESKYNDSDYGEYMIDGHVVNITKNIYLYSSTYTLGIEGEFQIVINDSRRLFKFLSEIY